MAEFNPQVPGHPISASTITQAIATTADAFAMMPEYMFTLEQGLGDQGLQLMRYFIATNAEIPAARESFSHWEQQEFHTTFNNRSLVVEPFYVLRLTLGVVHITLDCCEVLSTCIPV